MIHFQRRLNRAVLAVVAHPKLSLLIAALFVGASVLLAVTRLGISSDEDRLFSSNVRFFRDWLEFEEKFPENDALYVVVERANRNTPAPPVERWGQIADALAARLAKLTDAVASVDARVPGEKLGPWGLLFDDPKRVHESFEEVKTDFSQLIKL